MNLKRGIGASLTLIAGLALAVAVPAQPAAMAATSPDAVAAQTSAAPTCTTTITGRHRGSVVVSSGVTCLNRAQVSGPVVVLPGAGLVSTASTVNGPLSGIGAATVELHNSTVNAAVSIANTTAGVTVMSGRINGPVALSGNRTGTQAPVLAGVTITGPLVCAANDPAPTNLNVPNTVRGPRDGQCVGI